MPVIASVSPNHCPVGSNDVISLRGSWFGEAEGLYDLTFGGIQATIIGWDFNCLAGTVMPVPLVPG